MCDVKTKKCNKCGLEKPLTPEYYHRHSRRKDGFRETCKICRGTNYSMGEYRKLSIELGNKHCTGCNKIQPLENFHKRGDWVRIQCKKCDDISRNEYVEKNRDKVNEQHRSYLRKRKEDPNYRKQLTKKKREYKNKRLKEDPIYKMKRNIRKLLWVSICQRNGYTKKSKTQTILGCSWEIFIKHIESQFTEGMSWENHGQGNGYWNYDHIIPLSSAKTEEEVINLNHYTNFQPLWWEENLLKSDKISEEFNNIKK